jgi:hypothetical protein
MGAEHCAGASRRDLQLLARSDALEPLLLNLRQLRTKKLPVLRGRVLRANDRQHKKGGGEQPTPNSDCRNMGLSSTAQEVSAARPPRGTEGAAE